MSFGVARSIGPILMERFASPLQLGTFTGASTNWRRFCWPATVVSRRADKSDTFSSGTIRQGFPTPRKVIDLLMHKALSEGRPVVCLRGNHEQMLIVAAAEGAQIGI